MIRVPRAAKPRVLERNGASWTAALLAAIADGAPAVAIKKATDKYRHREIKDALVATFHGKCAYCESKITHIDYGDIEHYRPKSKFPEHTFDWENLLLGCRVCNGAEHKGDQFPEAADGGPIVNPCDDEPNDHLDFVFDAAAQLATVVPKTSQGTLTVDLLGLNRPELRAFRSRRAKQVAYLASRSHLDPEAHVLLTELRADSSDYAAFARAI